MIRTCRPILYICGFLVYPSRLWSLPVLRLGMSQHVAREILTEILIGNHERFPCNLRLYSDMDVGIFVDILRKRGLSSRQGCIGCILSWHHQALNEPISSLAHSFSCFISLGI